MLVTAPRSVPRGRALHARRAALVTCATCSQRRGFRFGPWGCGESDSEVYRDARRRHRNFRYRYMESLNRWDNHPRSEETKTAMKKAMAHFMRSSVAPRSDKYVNIDNDIKSWSDDVSGFRPGVRPGRNIEDAERDVLEHLFSRGQHGKYEYELWKHPLNGIRKILQTHRTPKEVTAEEVLKATESLNATTRLSQDTIDPITNRRVPKESSTQTGSPGSTESAAVSSRNNTAFTPKFEDVDHHPNLQSNPSPATSTLSSGPKDDASKYEPATWNEPDGLQKPTVEENSKKYNDLDKYSQSDLDSPNAPQKPTPEEESKRYQDLDSYKTMKWNEPIGIRKPTGEESSKNYKDLDSYGAMSWNEPDGLQKQTPEETSRKYNDLHRYKPVEWNEPGGLQKSTSEELSKEYDDLDQYGRVSWNEPDGLPQSTPEELSKDYKDLDGYEAVKWNEPDGLRQLTPEEKSKDYDDLAQYREPRTAEAAAMEEHRVSQLDPTPRGESLPPKVDVASEDPAKEYKDLGRYGPIYWNEPDGLQKPTPEEQSKNYDDLHRYGAVRWNEPDGLPKSTPEEKSKQYSDLPLYAKKDAFATESAPVIKHPEELSKEYQDLNKYVQYDNGDVAVEVHPEQASQQHQDLDKYSSQQFDSPVQKYPEHPGEPSKPYDDLHKYSTTSESTENIKRVHPEELAKIYRDLGKFSSDEFSDAGREPIPAEQAPKTYKDLTAYSESLHQSNKPMKQPSDTVLKSTSPYDSMMRAQMQRLKTLGSGKGKSDDPSGSSGEQHDGDGEGDGSDSLNARDVRLAVLRKARDNSQKMKLEQLKSQYEESWDGAIKEAQEKLEEGKAKSQGKLTGNYARDFPEEFVTSWSTANSPSKSTLFPENKIEEVTQPLEAQKEDAEASSMDESFPNETSRLEPALSRHARRRYSGKDEPESKQDTQDPYSKAPPGLETSFAKEDESSGWSTLAKHYGTETSAASGIKLDETVSYKILAYDPNTDSVRTAETTSSVLDTASPATPADVVLRLSHPAKFFPHFSSLQAAGYEIMSGQGDVLVFRKVRDGSPDAASSAPEPEIETNTRRPTPVNPIDMMGKPVTGNFASPTGFVNYDALPEDTVKPAPPFRSNIDVRKEEPVFSGQQQMETDKKKKRGLGKKVVIGTAWVAGGAYAVGVMGEYFATHGSTGNNDTRTRHPLN